MDRKEPFFCYEDASNKTKPPRDVEFASVSSGGAHACALSTDGTAYCCALAGIDLS
jgi:alpha-tubulin suppressor-like RCC1 family protein